MITNNLKLGGLDQQKLFYHFFQFIICFRVRNSGGNPLDSFGCGGFHRIVRVRWGWRGRAAEYLLSLSLHKVAGSLPVVSSQGLVVAFGEMDCLPADQRLQGEAFQQAGGRAVCFWPIYRNHTALLPPHSFSHKPVTCPPRVKERECRECSRSCKIEQVSWKVLLKPFWKVQLAMVSLLATPVHIPSRRGYAYFFLPRRPSWHQLEATVGSAEFGTIADEAL